MLTSHYGPRQGIYQSMESFRTPHWRAAHTDPKKAYRYKANNVRIATPPNSFPARSLTRHSAPHCACLIAYSPPSVSLATSPSRAAPSPRNKSASRSAPPSRIPIRTPAASRSAQHRPKLRASAPSKHSPSKDRTSAFSSLTSMPAELHPRPSHKSQIPQHDRTVFPYPDPMKIDGDSVFLAHLVSLARLEQETVRQEAFGCWGSQSSTNLVSRSSSAQSRSSSTTSLRQQQPLLESTSGSRTVRKVPPRPKSARADFSKRAKAAPATSASTSKKRTQRKPTPAPGATVVEKHSKPAAEVGSECELLSPLHTEQESTSDLGVSVESLCLSEEPDVALESHSKPRQKEAWQAQEGEREGRTRAEGKTKTVQKTSFCTTSPNKRGHVSRSAKTRKKS